MKTNMLSWGRPRFATATLLGPMTLLATAALLGIATLGCTSAQRHRGGPADADAAITAATDAAPANNTSPPPSDNNASDSTSTRSPATPVCQPGTVACDAQNRVVACASNGAAWQTLEICTETAPCNPNTATCAACAAACANKQCGDDGCGGSCGTCAGEATCTQGLCSAPLGACTAPPNGTGRMVGQQVKNLSYTDGQGQTVALHDFCGSAPAIILFETAMW